MKDWRSLAKANNLDLSAHELDRIVGSLDALETAFRPLVGSLTADHEPAVEFTAEEDER